MEAKGNREGKNIRATKGRTKREAGKSREQTSCANCTRLTTSEEDKRNKGYCNECTFEAVGEGKVTW